MNPLKLGLRVVFNFWPNLTGQRSQRTNQIKKTIDQRKAITIDLYRVWAKDKNTIAAAYFNGILLVYVLELPVVTGGKGEGINTGTYPVKITYSPKFKRLMPLVQNVPGRSGIRWHPGSDWRSTLGCLIPGFEFSESKIKDSNLAYDVVYEVMDFAQDKGYAIVLNVRNYRQTAIFIGVGFSVVILALFLVVILATKKAKK
jgi:hypothetical protein